jgi:WD40 repeat protein
LAAGNYNGTVGLWNVTSPTHPKQVSKSLICSHNYLGSTTLVAFSPVGHTLAVGAADTICLWNVTNPANPVRIGQPINGSPNGINAIAFSSNGHTLAAGSSDGTIWLWNMTSPSDPTRIGQPSTSASAGVNSLAFSPTGQILVSGNSGGTIRIWNFDMIPVIDRICTITRDALTAAQWTRYIPQLSYDPPCRTTSP